MRINNSKHLPNCVIIQDEALSLEKVEDYIGKRDNLEFVSIGTQLSDIKKLTKKHSPIIIFLDLKIRIGKNTDFQYRLIPKSTTTIIVSAIPLNINKDDLPIGEFNELPKPVSFECFNGCVNVGLECGVME